MLCEKCKNKPATVYITKLINGQKTEHMLCIDCARKEHALPEGLETGPVSVDSLLKGFFGASQVSVPGPQAESAVCPVCGMTMPKLAECGRFGCNECYKVFDDAALRTIKHIHGRKRHIGKIPARVGGAFSMRRKIVDLRTKLETHVSREEYEEAAKLRDEIKRLEKDLASVPEVKDDFK
ncbi:MAG: UvrB/UvrC motif-containing protein [Acidaminococcales bacterium]|jgi:protein arginine kinase activator|nr:UvrB/UvrC motif-containing protein [Acidaminococcales bacterium]